MLRHTKIELYKLVRRTRSYLGFGWMLLISGLTAYGLKSSPEPADMFAGTMPGDFVMVGSIVNVEFVAYFLMRGAMLTFVPLFICLVAGDLIAGETSDGTLRPLLARPVSRAKVLAAKYTAAVLYTFMLTLFLAVAALTVSRLFLGHGNLFTVENGVAIFGLKEAIMRLMAAYALSALGMLSVGTIAFFLSTLVGNSLASLGGAMMTMYALAIMGSIPYFQKASQYFFTTHIDAVRSEIFRVPIRWSEIATSAGYLAAYSIIFFIAAMFVFARKDVLA